MRTTSCTDVEQLSPVDGLVCGPDSGLTHLAVLGQQHQPAKSASTAKARLSGSAAGDSSPAASAADRFPAIRLGWRAGPGATAIDSVTGPGTHQRPQSLEGDHQMHRVGFDAVELLHRERGDAESVNVVQSLRPGAVSPRPTRTAAGTSATDSAASMLAAVACWSSSANFISPSPGPSSPRQTIPSIRSAMIAESRWCPRRSAHLTRTANRRSRRPASSTSGLRSSGAV